MSRVQIKYYASEQERDLLRQLAGNNISAYLRRLVREDARRHGVSLPDELLEDTRATHGGLNPHIAKRYE